MNRIINFIIWPAVGGLVFGFVLLQLPRLAELVPGLNSYIPTQNIQQITMNSFSDAVAKSAPAVVSINSTANVARMINEQRISPLQVQRTYQRDENSSLGSGVIISPDGYIITSFHIFELQDPDLVYDPESGLPDITVTLYNGQSMQARPILLDRENDLALLKVDATELAYITLAQASSLNAGDIVLAIGNPRNIGQSVTLGIVSALLNTGDSYVIQTDAAINPGNSGGALVDVNGKLVGINSTIVSESGGSEGISFAIPAQKAFDLMKNYIDKGPGGYLGVDGRFISRVFGNMMLDIDMQGLWVEKISPNGGADQAGLKINDVMISLADIEITSDETMIMAIQKVRNLGPGQTVLAKVYRDGEILELPIVLGVGEAVLYWSKNNQYVDFDPKPFGDNLLH